MIRRLLHAIFRRLAPIAYARALGVTVGRDCRLIDVSYSSEPYLIVLGDRVSATRTHFETHDGGVWVLRDRLPDLDVVRPIVVGDNVFIGHGTTVLPGTRIGSNVVIGAGSVVAGEIPGDSVVAGVPARVIGSLADYRAKAIARGQMTKPLSPGQKRAHWLAAQRKSRP